jgi:precorrin-6B methylase 2
VKVRLVVDMEFSGDAFTSEEVRALVALELRHSFGSSVLDVRKGLQLSGSDGKVLVVS